MKYTYYIKLEYSFYPLQCKVVKDDDSSFHYIGLQTQLITVNQWIQYL